MSMRYPGGLIASTPVTAAYPSGVWTQAQTAPYASRNVWMRDQYWPNTTLLLQGNGTNGAQNNTFLDSSTNAFTITRNGNTTQGSFTPYQANGYWSNYFGGSGDYLNTATDASAFAMGTGDYTIEGWAYKSGSGNDVGLFGTQATGIRLYWYNGYLQHQCGVNSTGGGGSSVGETVPATNQWFHWACVRSSGTIRLYINGVSTNSVSGATSSITSTYMTIGRELVNYTNYYWDGYISNVRVVKGTAVYTSNFTPPAAPLTAITNTSLLTCQSNRFLDNSTNAFAITVNGSPSVQAFQPFPGATTWSGAVLGGSMYNGASGDYISSASVSSLTGDFTVEAWFYMTSATSTYMAIVCAYPNSNGLVIDFGDNGLGNPLRFLAGGGSYNSTVTKNSVLNTWNHVALVKSGTTCSCYLNGSRLSTFTSSNAVPASGYAVGDGNGTYGTAQPFIGYISNVRVTTSALYSGTTYTVPTSPLTAISGTQLLLSMTNAGIFDSAAMNDLQTVGNAQVSTSVVKYGTGSMYFAGSGNYLQYKSTNLTDFGTGDFTIEGWFYTGVTTRQDLAGKYVDGSSGQWGITISITNARDFAFYNGNTVLITSAGSVWSTNTWTHFAVCRSGTSLVLYINGTSVGSATNSTSFVSSSSLGYVAWAGGAGGPVFNGYIDDLRITKGAARYIGNFTPPIARMPQE